MSFAFTHLFFAWILGKIYEKLSKKVLSRLSWFFLLMGSILPDADYLIDWTFGTEFHRTFTHSLLFTIVSASIIYLCAKYLWKREAAPEALFLALGILSHLLLDMFFSYGVPLLWPNPFYFSWTKIQLFNPATPSFLNGEYDTLRKSLINAIMDMGLGTAWIFYLWFKKKIQF